VAGEQGEDFVVTLKLGFVVGENKRTILSWFTFKHFHSRTTELCDIRL